MNSTIAAFIGGLALGAAGTKVILLALFWAVKQIREHEGTLDYNDEEDNE